MSSRVLPVLEVLLQEGERIHLSLQDLEEVPSSADRDISAFISSLQTTMKLDHEQLLDWFAVARQLTKGNNWTARQELLDEALAVIRDEIALIEDHDCARFLSKPIFHAELDQSLIIELHSSLAELVNRFSNSNTLNRADSPIDDLTRQTVIAMLESSISMLKSPIVDSGFMKNMQKSVAAASMKVAEKNTEKGLSAIMNTVVDLVSQIFDK